MGIDEIDRQFFSRINPYYHFHQVAMCMGETGENKVRVVLSGDEELDLSDEFFESFEQTKATAVRLYRYHQAETFFTILLGMPPDGSIPQMSKRLNGQLKRALNQISLGEIPDICEKSHLKNDKIEFSDWLVEKVLGFEDKITLKHHKNLCQNIQNEANFFLKTKCYNAFKHGCMVGHSRPTIETGTLDGVETRMSFDNAIGAINIEGKKKQEYVVTSYEEVIIKTDFYCVMFFSSIVGHMKKRRLSEISGEGFNSFLPLDDLLQRQLPESISLKVPLS